MTRQCANCLMFIDYRGVEEVGEANGYCCHPDHSLPDSPHAAYGGHWTRDDATCEKFTPQRAVLKDSKPSDSPDPPSRSPV